MSFLDFSQKVNDSNFPISKKTVVLVGKYVLRADLSYLSSHLNWLTCGAMVVTFGRVALPIRFDGLSVEAQRKVAVMLADAHFKQFYGKLPYEAMIENYRLCKNWDVIAVINVADFA